MDSVRDVVKEVSEAMKHCDITDIDADDHENPQLCAEYANEIYHYLLKYEVLETSKFQCEWKPVLNLICCEFSLVERVCCLGLYERSKASQ